MLGAVIIGDSIRRGLGLRHGKEALGGISLLSPVWGFVFFARRPGGGASVAKVSAGRFETSGGQTLVGWLG